jgi:carbon monoxide dehydrogenase subunit G
MDMAGERLISATKETVWKALNNAEILKASIPGCESLEVTSENEMTATVAVKLGPISAKFAGRVMLSDIDPPNGYRLSGEGKGGPAGFAKGAAKVRLAQMPDGTMLNYTMEAQVGGKIAQLGARLIDTAAKSIADQFFTKFVEQVQAITAQPQAAGPLSPQMEPAGTRAFSGPKAGNALWLLLAAGVAIAVAAWLLMG